MTFTNVLGNTPELGKTVFEDYQRPGLSAVPMSYIIDREGRIAAGWYGANSKSTSTLSGLGFK